MTSIQRSDAHNPASDHSKVSGFLQEPLAPEIIQGITAPNLKRSFPDSLRWFTAINQAHLLMLVEQGLIEAATAGHLLAHVADLDREGPEGFELDPEREDPWFNYEAELTRRAGPEAGRLHMARSRNDLKVTLDRMRGRKLAEDILEGCLTLRATLLEKAAGNVETVMPGYTHLQHAQPMTFGWYLLGIEAALARDAGRLEDALARLDECPLGAGAFAGTRFPIDRERTAELLGFSRPQPHSLDAVGNPDAMIEVANAATQLSMTIGRMSQDFYLWATHEFGMLSFPDRVASTSSIMPQKKNLTVLENLKGRPAVMLGALVTGVAALRAMPFGHSQELSVEASRWIWQALEDFNGMLPAARVVVESAMPRKDRMAKLAGENFATATTLADLLVSRHGLPFRDAHHVTGRYVRLAVDGTSPADAIWEAYREQTGSDLENVDALLAEAFDPAGVLDAITGCGPSRGESLDLLNQGRSRLAGSQESSAGRRQRFDDAAKRLEAACESLVAKARQERAS